MTTSIRTGESGDGREKIELVGKVEGFKDKINGAYLLRKEDGVLTVCDDKSVRVWLRRETGMYWPSIHHIMSALPTCLHFSEETGRLWIGLETGTVAELSITDDYNSLRPVKELYSHAAGVTDLTWSQGCEWLLSVGKDKALVWECSETGRRLGSYAIGGWCTCLEFDAGAKYAFVGDYSGGVSVLRLSSNSAELVTKLSGHSGSVRALAWDADSSKLFSASNDALVICWDIGGQKGEALHLHGHKSRVTGLALAGGGSGGGCKVALSGGDDGSLVAWDMKARREPNPDWANSDNCQRCDVPFFWNLRAMWDRKVVGLRQHHCRICGAAVCYNCSQCRVRHPRLGYEIPVRSCEGCKAKLEDASSEEGPSSSSGDGASLASFHQLGHSILGLDIDLLNSRLLSYGTDRLLKIWNLGPLLS